MSIQPVPPTTGPTTAGQLAARATQNDQALADLLSGTSDTMTPVSGTHTIPVTIPGGLRGYRVVAQTTFTTPDFATITLDPGAYLLENAPGGWIVHEISDGTPFTPPDGPTVVEDDFETDAADLFATTTPVGGLQWGPGLALPFGVISPPAPMQAAGGMAYHVSGNGGGALVQVEGLDWRQEVDYNFSGTGAGRQVRLAARGNPDYGTSNRAEMPVMAILRGVDGDLRFEPHWDGSAFVQLVVAEDMPLTGTLRLDVIGDTAHLYVNGTLLYTRTLEPLQQVGSRIGFGTYTSGRALAYRASRL